MLKKILYAISLLLLVTSCTKKEGFAVRKITSYHTPDSRWTSEMLNGEKFNELQTVFEQPFYYLAKGCQSYAFVSADGTTVLKFFRQRRLGHHTWQNAIPLPHSMMKGYAQKFENGLAQREKEFSGYREAYEHLKEETGLLYLHLNRTDELINKRVTLHYKKKSVSIIDIDKYEFVLQKKAKMGFDHLQDLMEEGETCRALNSVRSFLEIVLSRCQKGYSDGDLQFHKNFGFLGDQAIEIDIGYLQRDPTMKCAEKCQAEVKLVTESLQNWFNDNYKSTLPEVNKLIEKIIDEKCPNQKRDLPAQTLENAPHREE